MIKILFVIENMFFGGGEEVFAQIIQGLDRNKFEIYAACLAGGLFEEKIKDYATVIPIDLRKRFDLSKIFVLAKIIKENNIQIVHSQGARADFFARWAAKIAKVPATVSTVAMPVEGYNVNFFCKIVYIALDRFSEKFVDRFIVPSEALMKHLLMKHRIPREKIIKIYNGVEISQYRSQFESGCKIIEEFKIGSNVRVIGAIGRLVWQKGLTYLINAIKEIDVRYNLENIRCLIVGEGKERKSLERGVKRLGIEEKIIFTGFRKDIKEILQALEILVLPSIREGQPMILLEAMAMAKPIVATDIEGVNETVIDGVTGMLVAAGNVKALAEAMVYLLKDNEKARKMGQTAREVVVQRFALKDKIEQHQRFYEGLI